MKFKIMLLQILVIIEAMCLDRVYARVRIIILNSSKSEASTVDCIYFLETLFLQNIIVEFINISRPATLWIRN